MFNLVVATIIAGIIIAAAITIRSLLQPKKETVTNVTDFLNYLDRTREKRYASENQIRSRDKRYDEFRHEWYLYENEWADNFSMS